MQISIGLGVTESVFGSWAIRGNDSDSLELNAVDVKTSWSGFENPAAADHRPLDRDLHQRERILVQRVAPEHNEISEFALLDRAFLVLFE
jgi:hypothetical protein